MSKRIVNKTLSAAIVAVLYAGATYAQETKSTASLDEVVVTGSYIRGTPEDSALPVDVVTAEDLANQGSPTLVQLVKSMPAVSGGSVGESNRFLGNSAGTANINLRGFGALRTLVLLNSRRLATSPNGAFGAVDINLLPTDAIGTIEVLKDGAAATYGSDAVAGVVNFLTRKDLDGVEVDASYSEIQHSDGDYQASISWGKKLDGGNVLLTAGYRKRSEIQASDVDWAVRKGAAGFAENPLGGWSSGSNPGTYLTGTAAQLGTGTYSTVAGAFLDDGCAEMGGVAVAATAAASAACRFQFTNFDNLVNEENHYQLYGEANFDLSESVKFHSELMWAHHDVPEERVSPSQSTTQFPSPIAASGGSPGGGTSPYPARLLDQQSRYYIPATNPGLAAFNSLHCPAGGTGLPAYCANLPNGIIASQTLWRPYAYGGNPLYDDKANHNIREADAYRASAGLSGTIFSDIGWDAAVTWMDVKTHHQTPNEVVNRVQLALRGLGGPDCNAATGTPGVGPCMWFNPFSNGVAASAVNGANNPYYLGNANPAVVNNLAVIDWMGEFIVDDGLSRIAVADLVFNGDLPFHLGGDNFAWAAGAQGRYERLTRETNDLSDMATHPCVDNADDGVPGCTGGAGVYTFYAGISEYDVSRNVYAVFGELNAPLLDSDIPGLKSIEMSAAVRFEDYGGGIGSTTNPKISAKWQFFDFLALRASYGTTFRAPSPVVVATGSTRALAQFTDPRPAAQGGVGSLYRPVDTYNNPNLIPETADTFNVGLIFQAAGFRASIDYYEFKFKDELTTETGADIYRTMFPSAAASSWQCGNTALLARFTFSGGACSPENFLGVRSNQINGPTVDTSGIDFEAAYQWDGVLGGDIELGIAGNQILEYLRGAVRTIEGIQVAAPVDRVGTLELISAFYSYPEWKGNAFVNYSRESHNVRLDYRYTGSMEDRNNVRADGTLTSVDSYDQFDLTYRFEVTNNVTLMFAVQNISDAEPSFVRSQYNYDYTGANPLGRVFEIGAKVSF